LVKVDLSCASVRRLGLLQNWRQFYIGLVEQLGTAHDREGADD